MRKSFKIGIGVGTIVFVGLVAFMTPIVTRIPTPQADKITGDGIVGIVEGGSIAWIIPTQNGVILVDAGGSASSDNLRSEVNGRQVHGIFLTHGHFDHTAGARNYPETTVIAGPGEAALVSGEEEAGGWMARMSKPMMGEPDYMPPLLREFVDGEIIEIDGEFITAIHVPGHTKGSAAYLWKNVLFVGDTVVSRGDYVNELPKPLYDNYEQVPTSVAKLVSLDFTILADGHVGLQADGKDLLAAFLETSK